MPPNMQRVNLVSDKGEKFIYYHCEQYLLGRGAMGEVYKGWYADDPERKVAIKKVYARHAENEHIRTRAKREALLSVNHPNLIKMLGYCEFDKHKGPVYIISELVRGEIINTVVRRIGPAMRVSFVSGMMCSVLDALHCLHTHIPAVWHRDVKPSNIMVDHAGNAKLVDLGIATSDGWRCGTLYGLGFGTYPYAPPEQITGARDQVNQLSDIYSLGITFYELLTGVNPFAGGSELDIAAKQISMPLPYNKCIPRPLFRVLLKATAKKQSARYQTAEEFKKAVIKANGLKVVNWGVILLGILGVVLFILLVITLINR
jgi:serine/threonine-protein kinase